MRLLGKSSSLGEDISSFRKVVTKEIASEEKILLKFQERKSSVMYFHLISIALIAAMAYLMFWQNSMFFTWLIIAILLYSYNWLIFFIPTTTGIMRPEDEDVAKEISKERKWYALRLLLKERKLAIEIGLTVMLGGMLPLALSFTVIFGVAMFFAAYLGFYLHVIDAGTTNFILIQIVLIVLFYVMMLIIKPQAQGITKIGRLFRGKIKVAKSKGKGAILVLILIIAGLGLVASVLVFGAFLLPGFLIPLIWSAVDFLSINNLPTIAVMFASQLVIMRHVQGFVSRRMAEQRTKDRLLELNQEVLIKLDEFALLQGEERKQSFLDDLKGKYYSIAIYDIIAHDIFGHSPIYLFGVRLRYVLDQDVILYITNMTNKRLKEEKNKDLLQGPEERKSLGGRNVLFEYQKQGVAKPKTGAESRPGEFRGILEDKGGNVEVKAEYHNEGHPVLDQDPGRDTIEGTKESAVAIAQVETLVRPIVAETTKESSAEKAAPPPETSRSQAMDGAVSKNKVQGMIDLGPIEMASYTFFKLAFKNGLSVPIKREGIVDMDVTVEGKEITINTNELFFSFPELDIWHIVYQHKGKIILEMGRGVKDGMKIHRYNAIRLGLKMWNGSRKTIKQKRRQLK